MTFAVVAFREKPATLGVASVAGAVHASIFVGVNSADFWGLG